MSVDGRILDTLDPACIKSMLDADELEEIRVGIVPVIVGGKAEPSLTGLPEGFMPHERQFRLIHMEELEGVLQCRYARDRKRKAHA